jgi:hypothetical protein
LIDRADSFPVISTPACRLKESEMATITGPGRYSGIGSDGKKYVVVVYSKQGVLEYSTSDGDELVPHGNECEEFEILNSMGIVIRLTPSKKP